MRRKTRVFVTTYDFDIKCVFLYIISLSLMVLPRVTAAFGAARLSLLTDADIPSNERTGPHWHLLVILPLPFHIAVNADRLTANVARAVACKEKTQRRDFCGVNHGPH